MRDTLRVLVYENHTGAKGRLLDLADRGAYMRPRMLFMARASLERALPLMTRSLSLAAIRWVNG